MKTTREVWLTNPLTATKLNWDNPSRLLEQLHLCENGEGMADYGWVYLGSATVDFTIEKSFDGIIRESLQSAEKKLAELDAEYQRKRMEYTAQVDKLRSIGWGG